MASIYLDHNATTPLAPPVLQAMLPYFEQHYGNASSRHEFGRAARKAVDDARERVADAVGAHPSQVVFVSGGTEANNLVLKGAAGYMKPSQIAVSEIEHPSVMRPAQELAQQGWKLRKLAVDVQGRLDMEDLGRVLQQPTGLVSVMLANNETGTQQDVAQVADMARSRGAWVHTDAVQALGKMEVDFAGLRVHALTLSAHKIYGPKGAAALVLDKRLELKSLISGGAHEKGLRAGTENIPAIVGLGIACELARERLHHSQARLLQMRERLEDGLTAMGAVVFGASAGRLPNTSYFAFPGTDGETMVMELDRMGFSVASGSACSSGSMDPSPVLLAMGVERGLARGAVRVSLGKDNTEAHIAAFLQALGTVAERLKGFAAVAV